MIFGLPMLSEFNKQKYYKDYKNITNLLEGTHFSSMQSDIIFLCTLNL